MGFLNLLQRKLSMSEKPETYHGLIDLDNVVSDWAGWVFRQQGEIPKSAGLMSGRLQDMWPVLTEADVTRIVEDVRGYSDVLLVPTAYSGLWDLLRQPNVSFLYLSAAPFTALDARRDWLQRQHLPTPEMEGVLGIKHLDHMENKTSWIMEHGCAFDFIVDDHLIYLDAALFSGIPLRMVYDKTWNQGRGEEHLRVRSWFEINKHVKKLTNGTE